LIPSQNRIVLAAAIASRRKRIAPEVCEHQPMQPKAAVGFRQDNIIPAQSAHDSRGNFDDLSIANCRRHACAARLKAYAQTLPQQLADHLFKKS